MYTVFQAPVIFCLSPVHGSAPALYCTQQQRLAYSRSCRPHMLRSADQSGVPLTREEHHYCTVHRFFRSRGRPIRESKSSPATVAGCQRLCSGQRKIINKNKKIDKRRNLTRRNQRPISRIASPLPSWCQKKKKNAHRKNAQGHLEYHDVTCLS